MICLGMTLGLCGAMWPVSDCLTFTCISHHHIIPMWYLWYKVHVKNTFPPSNFFLAGFFPMKHDFVQILYISAEKEIITT